MNAHVTAGDAARQALVALQLANDATNTLDRTVERPQSATKYLDPTSPDGRSLDYLMLSIQRARNAMHAAVLTAPLSAWETFISRSRHVGGREVADAIRPHGAEYAPTRSGRECLVHEAVEA
jgi:hypothetical protein